MLYYNYTIYDTFIIIYIILYFYIFLLIVVYIILYYIILYYMLSYIFGYSNNETKEVLNDSDINEIKKIIGDTQTDEDKDLMYKSHSKNYELNKQIRRISTKIKLNKCTPNVYKVDDSYLDQDKPVHSKRIIRHHKRHDSLESVYEVVHRLAAHEQLEKETNEQLYCLNHPPTQSIPIPKRSRRR